MTGYYNSDQQHQQQQQEHQKQHQQQSATMMTSNGAGPDAMDIKPNLHFQESSLHPRLNDYPSGGATASEPASPTTPDGYDYSSRWYGVPTATPRYAHAHRDNYYSSYPGMSNYPITGNRNGMGYYPGHQYHPYQSQQPHQYQQQQQQHQQSNQQHQFQHQQQQSQSQHHPMMGQGYYGNGNGSGSGYGYNGSNGMYPNSGRYTPYHQHHHYATQQSMYPSGGQTMMPTGSTYYPMQSSPLVPYYTQYGNNNGQQQQQQQQQQSYDRYKPRYSQYPNDAHRSNPHLSPHHMRAVYAQMQPISGQSPIRYNPYLNSSVRNGATTFNNNNTNTPKYNHQNELYGQQDQMMSAQKCSPTPALVEGSVAKQVNQHHHHQPQQQQQQQSFEARPDAATPNVEVVGNNYETIVRPDNNTYASNSNNNANTKQSDATQESTALDANFQSSTVADGSSSTTSPLLANAVGTTPAKSETNGFPMSEEISAQHAADNKNYEDLDGGGDTRKKDVMPLYSVNNEENNELESSAKQMAKLESSRGIKLSEGITCIDGKVIKIKQEMAEMETETATDAKFMDAIKQDPDQDAQPNLNDFNAGLISEDSEDSEFSCNALPSLSPDQLEDSDTTQSAQPTINNNINNSKTNNSNNNNINNNKNEGDCNDTKSPGTHYSPSRNDHCNSPFGHIPSPYSGQHSQLQQQNQQNQQQQQQQQQHQKTAQSQSPQSHQASDYQLTSNNNIKNNNSNNNMGRTLRGSNWSPFPISPSDWAHQQSPSFDTDRPPFSPSPVPIVPHNSPIDLSASPAYTPTPPKKIKIEYDADILSGKRPKRRSTSSIETDGEGHDEIRDIMPLPGFQQAFGSTEIGRFSETFLLTPESSMENFSIYGDHQSTSELSFAAAYSAANEAAINHCEPVHEVNIPSATSANNNNATLNSDGSSTNNNSNNNNNNVVNNENCQHNGVHYMVQPQHNRSWSPYNHYDFSEYETRGISSQLNLQFESRSYGNMRGPITYDRYGYGMRPSGNNSGSYNEIRCNGY